MPQDYRVLDNTLSYKIEAPMHFAAPTWGYLQQFQEMIVGELEVEVAQTFFVGGNKEISCRLGKKRYSTSAKNGCFKDSVSVPFDIASGREGIESALSDDRPNVMHKDFIDGINYQFQMWRKTDDARANSRFEAEVKRLNDTLQTMSDSKATLDATYKVTEGEKQELEALMKPYVAAKAGKGKGSSYEKSFQGQLSEKQIEHQSRTAAWEAEKDAIERRVLGLENDLMSIKSERNDAQEVSKVLAQKVKGEVLEGFDCRIRESKAKLTKLEADHSVACSKDEADKATRIAKYEGLIAAETVEQGLKEASIRRLLDENRKEYSEAFSKHQKTNAPKLSEMNSKIADQEVIISAQKIADAQMKDKRVAVLREKISAASSEQTQAMNDGNKGLANAKRLERRGYEADIEGIQTQTPHELVTAQGARATLESQKDALLKSVSPEMQRIADNKGEIQSIRLSGSFKAPSYQAEIQSIKDEGPSAEMMRIQREREESGRNIKLLEAQKTGCKKMSSLESIRDQFGGHITGARHSEILAACNKLEDLQTSYSTAEKTLKSQKACLSPAEDMYLRDIADIDKANVRLTAALDLANQSVSEIEARILQFTAEISEKSAAMRACRNEIDKINAQEKEISDKIEWLKSTSVRKSDVKPIFQPPVVELKSLTFKPAYLVANEQVLEKEKIQQIWQQCSQQKVLTAVLTVAAILVVGVLANYLWGAAILNFFNPEPIFVAIGVGSALLISGCFYAGYQYFQSYTEDAQVALKGVMNAVQTELEERSITQFTELGKRLESLPSAPPAPSAPPEPGNERPPSYYQ